MLFTTSSSVAFRGDHPGHRLLHKWSLTVDITFKIYGEWVFFTEQLVYSYSMVGCFAHTCHSNNSIKALKLWLDGVHSI